MIAWEKTKDGYRKAQGNMVGVVYFQGKLWYGKIYKDQKSYKVSPNTSRSQVMVAIDSFLQNPTITDYSTLADRRASKNKHDWFSQGQDYFFKQNMDKSRFEVHAERGEFYFTLLREDGSKVRVDHPYPNWQQAANYGEMLYESHRI